MPIMDDVARRATISAYRQALALVETEQERARTSLSSDKPNVIFFFRGEMYVLNNLTRALNILIDAEQRKEG